MLKNLNPRVGEPLDKEGEVPVKSNSAEPVTSSTQDSGSPGEALENSQEGVHSLTSSIAKTKTSTALSTSSTPTQDSTPHGLGGAVTPLPSFLKNVGEVSAEWLTESFLNDTKGWEGWLKDLAQSHNEKVSAYREIMDTFSQEHPFFAAVAQGINEAEGLNLMFFPETKGEALGTGLALIAGRTRPMTLKMLSRPKPSLRAVDKPTSETFNHLSLKVKKGEQPWAVRSGQEWKGRIIGRAQKTRTDGHALRSYRIAIKEAKKPDTKVVLLNRGVKRATEEHITPNTRPDVTVVRKDGKVDQFEVPSKTDRKELLQERMDDAIKKFSKEKRGDNKVISITENKGESNDK